MRAAHESIPGLLIVVMLAQACAERPQLSHTFRSEHALAERVLGALAARDIAVLEALPLSEQEFEQVVWPDLPASRPEMNLPADYAWRTLAQNSRGYLARLLATHGGRRYRLVRIDFDGETTHYDAFVVHRKSRLVIQDEAGHERTLRLFGSVLERAGEFKLFSYVAD
jgi:hypothetical protein